MFKKNEKGMNEKKLFSLVFSLMLMFGVFAGCGSDSEESSTESKAGVVELVNDGTSKITDAKYDSYFGGNALTGVTALLNEGEVYVNGIAVPASSTELAALPDQTYEMNMIPGLYYNPDKSTYGYAVHKYVFNYGVGILPGVTDLPMTFETARIQFVENLSQRRGRTTRLTLNAAGQAERIDLEEFESVLIGNLEDHGSNTTIDRTTFTLETGRYPERFDVNNVFFPTSNVDFSTQVGDFAVWYLSPDGWNLKRAVPVVGLLTKDASKFYHINDTDVRYEADCSRFNLATASRPTQFYTAYTRLGLTAFNVTVWCVPGSGNPIGFTYGSDANAKSALDLAITNAEGAKTGVVVSIDGTDVATGTKWVTQATMDAFNAAIAAAQVVYDNPANGMIEYDSAIYDLGVEIGAAGATPPGFIGSQGDGTM